MEALGALSLACNILQLVDTGLKVTAALKQIRDEHKPDASVTANATTLRELSHEIDQSLKAQSSQGPPGNTNLLARARDMTTVSQQLEKLLHRFSSGQKSRIRDVIKYYSVKGDIQSQEKRLRETQQALQSTILVELRDIVNKEWATISKELPSLKSELQSLVTELRKGNTTVSGLTDQMNEALHQTLAAITFGTEQATKATTDISKRLDDNSREPVRSLQSREERAAMEDVLNSLYFTSMNARRNMSSLEHAHGTFDWVFERQCRDEHHRTIGVNSCAECSAKFGQLHHWLMTEDQRIFWISGNAGTGKSTLIQYLLRNIHNIALSGSSNVDTEQPLVLSAFIWAAGDEMQRSIKGLLCTLLHQCLTHDLTLAATISQTLSFSRKKTPFDWSERELRQALESVLHRRAKSTYIFVDGLDEISQRDGSAARVVSILSSLQEHQRLKVCVSSRPEPFFERSFQQYPHLRLQILTYGDILQYVSNSLETELLSLPPTNLLQDCSSSVIEHIAQNAQGSFLWVELVIRSLKEGFTNYDTWDLLWVRIAEMPDDLETLYESMLQRRGSGTNLYHDSAGIFFKLLLGPEDFQMNTLLSLALYTQHDLRAQLLELGRQERLERSPAVHEAKRVVREQLRAQCAGLLELPRLVMPGEDTSSEDTSFETRYGLVTFIHRTARDFMLDQGRRLWQHVDLDWEACIDTQYLAWSSDIASMELWAPLTTYDCWDVALLDWCKKSADFVCSESVDRPLEHLSQIMRSKSHWCNDQRNPAIMAAYINIEPPRHWIDTWRPTGMSGEIFLNQLLLCAAEKGCDELSLWLLDQGADPFWRDIDEARGSNWPTAFQCIVSIAPTRYQEDIDDREEEINHREEESEYWKLLYSILRHQNLKLDDEVVVVWSMLRSTRHDRALGFYLEGSPFLNKNSCSIMTPQQAGPMSKYNSRLWNVSRMSSSGLLRLVLCMLESDEDQDPRPCQLQLDVRDILHKRASPGIDIRSLGWCEVYRSSPEYTGGKVEQGAELSECISYEKPPSSERLLQDLKSLWEKCRVVAFAADGPQSLTMGDGWGPETLEMESGEGSVELEKMNGQETMEWLIASGLPEDRRDRWWEWTM
ncbi:uncharacterized protein B0I36DRAFT_345160 [Microdochium trichocladiopsis]|uniref:NACHT domain-containing protein n=1 Tax=Microdochium trichocladiopsis TaxID=1682393 RepID=A0A9P8YJC6_9PEZI|nr:uncharacterized protein B0I36DRAFT_345160 [Microdochium trichocladiopsis]KAH7041571.1 hypothetical protein B0I36DRAFT_345160 [Microdochium trichocladiopsis]